MAASFIRSSSEGALWNIGPFHIRARVEGPQSTGLFELYELAMGPATIDYHVHHTMDETLAVIEGEVVFNVAGVRTRHTAGSVAFVPRGIHHGFTNPGPGLARVLITFTPAGRQHEYFARLEQLFAAPTLDTAAVQALQQQYDQALVPE